MGGGRRRERGAAAEELAARHLEAQGYRVRARNVRAPLGEIDLVAEEGDTLVFVEVRGRTSTAFGSALESITPAKRRRLVRLALLYLQGHPHAGPWRIDVVAVDWRHGQARVEVFPSAVEGGR